MKSLPTPIYFLEYKDKILSLVVELDGDLDFYYDFEVNFNNIVVNLFNNKLIMLLSGQDMPGDGIIKSDFRPVLPSDYDTMICTFIKKYKYSVKTVVLSTNDEKLKFYNDKNNSDRHMRNLNVCKKINACLIKDEKDRMYFWGVNNVVDITDDQYSREIIKAHIWP